MLGCLETRGLDVFALPPGDPMLGGARAVFDREYVAYDAGLPGPAATFSLAHELGHTLLHGGHGGCAPADIDDECDTTLQTAPGGVEVYSPRQQREQEANAFAAAFLMPAAELRAAFLAGLDYNALAARYGVSESAMLNTLAAALLTPQAPAAGGPPPEAADPAPPAAPLSPPPGPAAIRLDPSQEAAATVAHGPVLIDAGPGTGKTRTLIERVLFLLRRGAPATAILALTFSNRAAAEMRERLRVAGPDAEGITVGTFHAFCLQFLQEHAAEAGLPLGPRLIDSVQATAWLETRLPELRLRRYGSLFDPGRCAAGHSGRDQPGARRALRRGRLRAPGRAGRRRRRPRRRGGPGARAGLARSGAGLRRLRGDPGGQGRHRLWRAAAAHRGNAARPARAAQGAASALPRDPGG